MTLLVEGVLIGAGLIMGVAAVNVALISCAMCISATAKSIA